MRTNIDLDAALVEEAFRYADVRTKKDLVHLALREFIAQRRRLDMRDLRGSVRFADGYDPKRLREDPTSA
jgi:Arc/MetJ family transcription regulator